MRFGYLAAFIALFVFRYVRAVVGVFTFLLYKPKPLSSDPSYKPADVSVIVPTTFKNPDDLMRCLTQIVTCSPAMVYVVTAVENTEMVESLCRLQGIGSHVCVLGVERLNKRHQMLCALRVVTTNITVFADDNVFWPEQYLDYLLAIFDDEGVGAGGTRQRVCRNDPPNVWNFLGIAYLERRNWNNVLTNAIDGSISTLSGRTAAYRTSILQTEEFYDYLINDMWRGQRLNSDDDKCLTRYVYSHGWNITIQFDSRSVLQTTLESNPKFISQCKRWGRAHWRGNFTVMTNESYWCSPKYFWGLYCIYIGQFQTPALLFDGLLVWLLVEALTGSPAKYTYGFCAGLGAWILATKTVKLIPHLCRHPQDIKFLPVSWLFSYLHGFINLYTLATLHRTHWGANQQLQTQELSRAAESEATSHPQHPVVAAEVGSEPESGTVASLLLPAYHDGTHVGIRGDTGTTDHGQ